MPYANTAPLTDAHLTLLNGGLRSIHDARKIMDRAEAAGMDLSQHRQTADQMEQALTGFKEQFFNPKGKKGDG